MDYGIDAKLYTIDNRQYSKQVIIYTLGTTGTQVYYFTPQHCRKVCLFYYTSLTKEDIY